MAWLTSYSDENKIIDGEDKIRRVWYTPLGAGSVAWDLYSYYRYVGMTYDAAVICRDDLHDPTGTPPVIAQLKRENSGGAYMVTITEVTLGTYVAL